MLLADNVDNRDFLRGVFEAVYAELPEPKKKTGAPGKGEKNG